MSNVLVCMRDGTDVNITVEHGMECLFSISTKPSFDNIMSITSTNSVDNFILKFRDVFDSLKDVNEQIDSVRYTSGNISYELKGYINISHMVQETFEKIEDKREKIVQETIRFTF